MNRAEVIRTFGEVRGDAIVVLSPGGSSALLWECRAHPGTIYNMELAYSTSLALGIAYGAPDRRVVSVEGDGSLFAATPILGTISRHPAPNLTVIVVANGIWGTGLGSVTTTMSKWADLAIACNWNPDKVAVASETGPFKEAVQRSLTEPGPWFICAITERWAHDGSGQRARPPLDAAEAADITRRYLQGVQEPR